MKITNSNRQSEEVKKQEKSFDAMLKDLIAKYKTIFLAVIDDMSFVYKPLSRKDYWSIIQNGELSDFEKEDEVCAVTVLWPENIDWDNIEAGVPTQLCKEILQNSFLDSPESIAFLIEQYREDLSLLDTQMSCIISEAFPTYDIEDIESWDMIKFCKIYSRAEWKLKNLRKIDDVLDVTEQLKSDTESNYYNEESDNNQTMESQETPKKQQEFNNQSTYIQNNGETKIKVGSREMTKQEYDEYLKMKSMFPEINWEADAMFTGYESQTASTIPSALR